MYLGPNIIKASATLLSFKDDISVASANAAVFCALCVVVVVSLLQLMYLGVVRPYHATVEAVLAVCNASLIIGIALSSASVAFTPNGDGIDADGSATMALTVLAYCQVAADSFYFVQTLVLLAFAVYDGCLRSVDPTAEGETVESAAPLLVLGPLHEGSSTVVDPSGGKDAPQQLENHEVSQRVSNPLTAAAHHA